MRGTLETIVGAMFAGKTSELLKRILWAEHQGKRILVIKPIIDNRRNLKSSDPITAAGPCKSGSSCCDLELAIK